MKIQLLSDLHLEAHPQWVAQPAPDADLLVLAGDIGSYQAGSLLTDSDFGLSRFSPLHSWPTPVLFVPGNHEYDTLDFDAAHTRLRETCIRLGITWLEREAITLNSLAPDVNSSNDSIRFIGTTLWSDFDALAAQSPRDGCSETSLLRSREKAYRAANYYLRKTGTTWRGELMLAEQVRELSLDCQQWLRLALSEPFDGTTVVITHFAPSLQSADPRYGLTPGTAGFCNNLDDLLPHAHLWLHGHLHAPSDYVKSGCRIVANPLGYVRKREQELFIPKLTIDTTSL
ncbi:MAG TPA: metallophosphoesterase [Burkholderiaceae bacterium]|nr:metallophosphoesterase [Burkholderiaceae bacterium]